MDSSDGSLRSERERAFVGSIPEVYERLLVPMIFQPYADDLVGRVASEPVTRVLETAAGTGVVTRLLSRRLPQGATIVATDFNEPMLDEARAAGTDREVQWERADAQDLPYPAASFDCVVCQFGVMFFPDRVRAFSEARRVLRPGGRFCFNAWDELAANEFPDAVTTAINEVFPDDPIDFMARVPHGYFDPAAISRDLADAGFDPAEFQIDVVGLRSHAASARDVAVAFCHGTPTRSEILARDADSLPAATDASERVVRERFGVGRVEGDIRALVVTARA